MKLNKYWFVPKKWGYGARPVTWEGWVLVLFFAVCMYLIIVFLDSKRVLFYLSLLVVIILISFISKIKTNGKWKWR